MTQSLARATTVRRRLALGGIAVLITAVFLALAWLARHRSPDIPPLSKEELTAFGFDPYMIGYLFQGLLVQAALIYLFSNAHAFRRTVTGQPAARDSRRLFGLLALIQVLVVAFEFGRPLLFGPAEPAPATIGLLVVVTAGLIGGWRLGLAVGVAAWLLRGTQQVILILGGGLHDEFSFLLQTAGWEGLLRHFPWGPILLDFYFRDLWVSSAVWAGVAAGLTAELLGERRYAPLNALLLGVGIDLGAGYLTTIAAVPPGVLFLIPNLLVSGVAVAAVALMVRNVQATAARRRAEAAELARAQAELRALRAQINPHFLFNALNTIRYFVRTDPEAARRLLLNLSEVFQRALRSGEFVPLRDELSYVEAYLALEQARLDRRLQVEWSVPAEPDPERPSPVLDQPVPTLILQPIVENAIVHGIARKPEGGTVLIAAANTPTDLVLQVGDDGPGIPPERLAEVLSPAAASEDPGPPGRRPSIGLRNVDGRLRALYGEKYRLDIESQVGQGTWVRIRVPLGR